MNIRTIISAAGLTAAALALSLPGLAAAAPAPGDVVVSETRFRGPVGAADEYIELTNRTSTPQDLTGSTICSAQSGGTASNNLGSPTATIPANSSYIYRNSGATSLVPLQTDATFGGGISDDRAVGLFTGVPTPDNAANVAAVCAASNRIDSFAITFTGNGAGGAAQAVYTEGTAEAPLGTTAPTSQLAYIRRYSGGRPVDTDNNAADFMLVAPQEGTINNVQPIFGTPGLQRNPVRPQGGAGLAVTRFDTAVSSQSPPNRDFDGTNLRLRRTITNNTGAPITSGKLRVVDITTNGAQTPSQVDLRLVDSTSAPAGVFNTTLDTDAFTSAIPTQGGLNSAVRIGSIAAGASVNVQIQFTVLEFDTAATPPRTAFRVALIPEG